MIRNALLARSSAAPLAMTGGSPLLHRALVEDMDAALRTLAEKGVQTAWGPIKRPEYARAEVRDPDGNPIELRQWYRA